MVHIPYSSGFGIGYRFKEWINLRANQNGIVLSFIIMEKFKTAKLEL